jgi:hypothetical protein
MRRRKICPTLQKKRIENNQSDGSRDFIKEDL